MDKKTIVKYATYLVGGITLVSLINSAPLQVIILAVCAGINILYVGKQ